MISAGGGPTLPAVPARGTDIMAEAHGERDPYREAGVDIDAGHRLVARIRPLVAATARPGVLGGIGGFGGLFDLDASGHGGPVLVAATDGVGTKLVLAREAGRTRGLGVDLVAMCVNDLVVQGAEPLFFLDYYATGRLAVEEAAEVIAGIAAGCREAGCALLGGETAEMPGVYAPGEFDLAGFAVGAVRREELLPKPAEPGDVLLGLAASGVHANGFSLVRRVLRARGLAPLDPAPFAPGRTLADELLTPTRIYVRAALDLARAGLVRALVHVTGGGLLDNPPRVLPAGRVAVIDVRRFPLPPVFRFLAEAAAMDARSLARTFNCGIGMIAVVPAAAREDALARLEAAGERVWEIGRIEAGAGPAVVLEGVEEAWRFAASRS